jgi:hypothetical protein
MMDDEMRNARLRRAPSGKIYVVWHGEPICGDRGNLLYFDDENAAIAFLERYATADMLGASAT